MGPQVGKMCKCGGLPTLFQLQVQHYPFVQMWPVRSGIFSCKRRRRFRPSSREPCSDQGKESVLRRGPGGVTVLDVAAATSTPVIVESTALKPRIDVLRATLPQPPIRLGERVDFHVGELEASVAQRLEGGGRPLEERGAKLLVCQNLSDDVLHGLLHEYTLESSPFSERPPWQCFDPSERCLMGGAKATRLPPRARRESGQNR